MVERQESQHYANRNVSRSEGLSESIFSGHFYARLNKEILFPCRFYGSWKEDNEILLIHFF